MSSKLNWFPQHMLHAARDIQKLLAHVDLVVEVRDARVPVSSSSPMLQALLPERMPVLVVLNKADLANPNLNDRALRMLGKDRALLASCGGVRKGHHVERLVPMALELLQTRGRRASSSGPLHVAVVGVPNAGKSSLINCLRGHSKAAKEGAKPGLTRHVGAFRVSSEPPLYVLDTPGVMAPASTMDEPSGRRLAMVGCVSESAARPVEVHEWLMEELQRRHYSNTEHWALQTVAQRVFRRKVDAETVAQYVLKEFRSGAFGRITLDELFEAKATEATS